MEFALVLPLILVLALSILQVGLLAKDQLVLEGSARAGAREAAVTVEEATVRRVALEAAASLDLNRISVAVQRQAEAGSGVTVTVRYEAPVVIPAVAWLFPQAVHLSARATMRQETR